MTRERVLAAARRTFARLGYAATTNRDIAREAGLTPGALYHYMESKADLYAAVYDEVQNIVYTEFELAAASAHHVRDRLCAVIDSAVALNRSDPTLGGFINVVATDIARHPELHDVLAVARGRTGVFLGRLVADAADRGELAPGVTADAVQDMFNAMLAGMSRLASLASDPDRHAAAATAFKRMVAGTLFA